MLNVAERPAEGKAKSAAPEKFHTVSDLRKAQLWLDDQVQQAGDKVTSIVTTLTPELATVLLERNPANRKVKPHKVQDYAHDMTSGAWEFNGEPVIVANDGLLNDGQHRALAVLESKTSIPIVLVLGVARDTRETLDQGAPRASADYLAMRGTRNPNNIAAIGKAVWQWRTYGYLSGSGNKNPTRSEVLETVSTNPGINKSFDFVNRPNARALRAVSVLGFTHFATRSVAGPIASDFFMDALIDGTNLKAGDPILIARNRLLSERGQMHIPERAELLFRAWNAHRLSQTRVIFRITGGDLPLLEA